MTDTRSCLVGAGAADGAGLVDGIGGGATDLAAGGKGGVCDGFARGGGGGGGFDAAERAAGGGGGFGSIFVFLCREGHGSSHETA